MMLRRAAFLALAMIAAQPALSAPPPAKPAPAAHPFDVEKRGATGAVLTFINCAHFGSDTAGRRAWIAQSGLTEAPPDLAKTYLMGKTGKVYGGTTEAGDVVIASRNDGSCSVFVGHANSTEVVQGFETWLGQNNFTFKSPKAVARKDKNGITSVTRDYAIKGDGGPWHAVISVVTDGKPRFEAILTAYRNKH